MVFENVGAENAIEACPSLLAIDDKFEAPVTALPIHTGLVIPIFFRPAFTINSFAVPIPMPAHSVGYFFLNNSLLSIFIYVFT